jgi:hypothetical protein
MRYLNALICVLLALFAAVQYNDPDGLLWAAIYLVPAIWSGFAAYRPSALGRSLPMAGLAASVIAAVIGTIHYWPDVPEWWRVEVWWEAETAREGMGVMIVLAALLVVLLTGLRARKTASGGPERDGAANLP